MTITIITDDEPVTDDWKWQDDTGKALLLGSWVRTSPLITCQPTGYPKTFAQPGQRVLDYGRVYELLPNGTVRIQWLGGPVDVIQTEDPAYTQLTTKDAAEAFCDGVAEGFERGNRMGRITEVNEQRERIGLPALSDDEWDSLVEQGQL